MERPKSATHLFNTKKNATDKFFKDSQVGSCSHVVVKNGVSIAIPFTIRSSKGNKLQSYITTETFSSENKSLYR